MDRFDFSAEIDKYFYGDFDGFKRRNGEDCVRVTTGGRENVPVRDWMFSRTILDAKGLQAFASYFFAAGIRYGNEHKISAENEDQV